MSHSAVLSPQLSQITKLHTGIGILLAPSPSHRQKASCPGTAHCWDTSHFCTEVGVEHITLPTYYAHASTDTLKMHFWDVSPHLQIALSSPAGCLQMHLPRKNLNQVTADDVLLSGKKTKVLTTKKPHFCPVFFPISPTIPNLHPTRVPAATEVDPPTAQKATCEAFT